MAMAEGWLNSLIEILSVPAQTFVKDWFSNNVTTHFNYPKPDPNNDGAGVKIHKIDIQDPTLMSADFPLAGEIWFYETTVTDNYLGTVEVNERASSASLWNDKFKTIRQ